jgi:hypothetical protein
MLPGGFAKLMWLEMRCLVILINGLVCILMEFMT